MAKVLIVATLIALVSVVAFYLNKPQALACGEGSDVNWHKYPVGSSRNYTISSHYITMRDGVQIAVDVMIPADKVGQPLPTILQMTRYYRNWQLRWPFNKIFGKEHGNFRSIMYIERFIASGYVWVAMDVRGTGASGGNRPHDFHQDEIDDLQEVLDWVLEQAWCNGSVGAFGISYDGMTALHLAAGGNPAVKAIAPMFSPIDIFDDIGAPGGLWCKGFLTRYQQFTTDLEQGVIDIPDYFGIMARAFIHIMMKGVYPVDVNDEATLQRNMDEHRTNWNMVESLSGLSYRDEEVSVTTGKMNSDDVSLMGLIGKLKALPVAIYHIAGAYDSGCTDGLATLQHALQSRPAPTKFTLGPWNHGARADSHTGLCFDLPAELVRFMDAYLKNDESTGIQSEPPVHYFTVGQEAWKTSSTWPPVAIKGEKTFYLRENQSLRTERASSSSDQCTVHVCDTYQVDWTQTTSPTSRWNLCYHIAKHEIKYPNRAEQAQTSLVYESQTLTEPLTVTGIPQLHLFLRTDRADAAIFAYIEVVKSDGSIKYLTEGMLRAIHRKLHDKSDPQDPQKHPRLTPFRSYRRGDSETMPEGEVEELVVFFETFSASFLPGEKLRLVISGADSDNFDLEYIADLSSSWEVFRSSSAASALVLPVEN